jgi:hypothetical protein
MINVSKLHKELENVGLPVCCVRDGMPVADYTRKLTAAEIKQADAIVAAHDPTPSLAERRVTEYEKQGCTQKALIVALWELVVENRPDAATALELVRERVKEDIANKQATKEVKHAKR